MHDPATFVANLRELGVRFWTGVPDSLMAPLSAHLARHAESDEHLIAVNEGAAVALAAGNYFATGRATAVYLQNSGLGNTVNPILSLARPFDIPMLLIIGWRGEPGGSDEPQHRVQGATMLPTLDAIEIPHAVLDRDPNVGSQQVAEMLSKAREELRPCAIVVRGGTFAPSGSVPQRSHQPPLTREAAIRLIANAAEPNAVIVATTGKAGRELDELRHRAGESDRGDLLVVGSMGHAGHVALGVAIARPERPIWLLDGDGALLMHQGAMTMIGSRRTLIRHVLLNNAAHESVGGQPTPVDRVDFAALAANSGYLSTSTCETEDEITAALKAMRSAAGPSFLEIPIRTGSRPDLGRPRRSPSENRADVMAFLAQ